MTYPLPVESVDTSEGTGTSVLSDLFAFHNGRSSVKCFVAAFQHLFLRLYFPKLSGSPSDAHNLGKVVLFVPNFVLIS